MANKLAPYKDEAIIKAINKWWRETYPFNEAHVDNHRDFSTFEELKVLTISDLYQSYYIWCEPIKNANFRLTKDQFAKCLMAARIIDIGGRWRQATDWEPTEGQIRRVTGEDNYSVKG